MVAYLAPVSSSDPRLHLPALQGLKPEWEPLFAPGYPLITLAELREICVGQFSLSSTRDRIMSSIELVAERLHSAGIGGQLWIDGSFVTRKIDPKDADLVLRALITQDIDENNPLHHAELDWYESITKTQLPLDTFLSSNYPVGHPDHDPFEYDLKYWSRTFGTSRRMLHKGIPVVRL
jgi:hypothetical protein